MELNTINKTGTWSEAADRLNNNFSKTSTEVEKVKQNGIRNKVTGLLWVTPYRVLYINAKQRENGVLQARQEVAEILTYPAT